MGRKLPRENGRQQAMIGSVASLSGAGLRLGRSSMVFPTISLFTYNKFEEYILALNGIAYFRQGYAYFANTTPTTTETGNVARYSNKSYYIKQILI
jgi:hypothetical protein